MAATLYQLLQERNARETFPFVAIHNSNATLVKDADTWQRKCEELECDITSKQESLEQIAAAGNNSAVSDDGNNANDGKGDESLAGLHYAESAALKNERKMREELERLRSQVKSQQEQHLKDAKELKESNRSHSELKELYIRQEQSLSELKDQNERQDRALNHLNTQVSDSEQRANLAEQQHIGLKDTIRLLQEENDVLKKENQSLEARFIDEKSRLSSEVNSLNEMLERLKVETAMLQSVKKQEEKRQSWFGFASSSSNKQEKVEAATVESSMSPTINQPDRSNRNDAVKKTKAISVSMPSQTSQVIQAHRQEASCVRCDHTRLNMIVTGGSIDGSVKVWNLEDGSVVATLRGGSGNHVMSCDIANGLVIGGGSDKTCRVWDIESQRMLHLLVGHTNIITCVRFVSGGRGVVTASKDRQIKVWDISKQTYRQSTNIVLNSTANSIDIADDSYTMVSGHTDGGLRFWDIRTGQRNGEIKSVHTSPVTSVQFHPSDCSKVLTNGMDSRMKLVDIPSCKILLEFSHIDFQTSYSWSSSVFSPDGGYVASGSSSNGFIFVWNAKNGNLMRTIEDGHGYAGVCGITWGNGRVQSVDKTGKLILWS